MSVKRVRSFPLFPSQKELASGQEDLAMEVDAPARAGNKRTYVRPGMAGNRSQPVCTYWLEGRCNRDPCAFLHVGEPGTTGRPYSAGNGVGNKRSNIGLDDRDTLTNAISSAPGGRRNVSARWGRSRGSKGGKVFTEGRRRVRDKPCTFFLRGNCTRGDQCNFLHSHTTAPDLSFMTHLIGHEKGVRAIALPAGSNKLYTGGQDETIRIWDCETGQCTNVISMGGDVGCLLSESGWLFVGLLNEVKAWNLQNNAEQSLNGPKGQVHALAVYNGMLFAGAQDGNILAWKFNPITNMFEPAASLWGHTGAVVTLELFIRSDTSDVKLCSGSMDKSIRVWDLSTGQCLQTLQVHANVVMGLLCWSNCLLSCSLDGTVRAWGLTKSGALEVQFTYPGDSSSAEVLDGALCFCGFVDQNNRAVLLCSYNDNTVRVLELPSFVERGMMFSREEVRALQVGPGGLVFSGDSSGEVKVWKWAPPDE